MQKVKIRPSYADRASSRLIEAPPSRLEIFPLDQAF
jgi:hypothetical protein